MAKTLDFLPKSLVELNSILLKITFGSYKFFGFFKRANYNSNLNLGEISVFLLYYLLWVGAGNDRFLFEYSLECGGSFGTEA